MNGSEIIKPVTSTETVIAHSTIYIAKFNSSQRHCPEDICTFDLKFKWLGDQLCKANVICPTLQQNPCADFGIVMNWADGQDRICYENHQLTSIITHGQSIQSHMWYAKDSKVDVECFFWCTESGKIPIRHPDRISTNAGINQLLNETLKETQLDFAINVEQKFVLNPTKVYHIQFDSKNLKEDCQYSKCYRYFQSKYYGDESCKLSFVCPTMNGNPCGDYQLR